MRRLSWLAGCLMVAILVLTSCQPAPAAPTEGKTVKGKVTEGAAPTAAAPAKGPEAPAVVPLSPDTPRYGGTITTVRGSDIPAFDVKFAGDYDTTAMWTNEKLAKGDWARGPAGTGEVEWILPGIWASQYDAPMVAESWEWPDNETIMLFIRKGIHFQNKAPAFGRELTAEDVVYSIERKYMHEDSQSFPTTEEDRVTSVRAVDKWTVEVKVPEHAHGSYIQGILAETWMYPKELGMTNITDWRDVIGTGPWIVDDVVIQSSISFRKNPTYWLEDPVHPGNKLPYADKMRILVIADPSTGITAVRTGKIDQYRGLAWDEGESLMKTNPELLYQRYLRHTAPMIWMRLDKAELPYQDIRVRRALSMAIDRDAIIEGYYRGNAEKFAHPVMPTGELADIFVPLSELSAEAQERYEYHPDRAKQLLAEAGYPNGFKATIICTATQVDVLSIVKQMWSGIGVELALDVKETGAWTSIQRRRGYDDMLWAQITGIYYTVPLPYLDAYQQYNRSAGYDQYVEDYFRQKILPYRGPLEDATLRQNYRELIPYLVDLVWAIELPSDYFYNMWQPWLRGYHGEYATGRGNFNDWPMYVWIDQDMKFSYTGQRD